MPAPMNMGGGRALRSFRLEKDVHTKNTGATLRRIVTFAKPHRGKLAIFLLLIALDAGLGALNPLVVKRLIDNGVVGQDMQLVIWLAAALAGLALLGGLLTVAERWLSSSIGEGLVLDMRTSIFDHVQSMPMAFFSRARTGALIQRASGDVQGAQQALTSTLSSVVSNVLTVVFTLSAMLTMSWKITLVALLVLPFFIVPAKIMAPKMAEVARKRYESNADISHFMEERFNASGAHLAKTYGTPARESAAFRGYANKVRDIGITQTMYGTGLRAGLATVAALAVAVVYGLGGAAAISGTMTVGSVVAMATYLTRLYGPLVALSNLQVDVMTALVSFERVFEVLDLVPTVTEKPEAKDIRVPIATGGASIDLDHVSFRYPTAAETGLASLEGGTLEKDGGEQRDILSDVTIHAAAGTMTALVGPSGAGKSTLSHLISRLYDPTKGTVSIAGLDLRDATMESVRDSVGIVSQEAHVFHDTVGANLRYARPDATDAELWDALRRAHLDGVVAAMPDGLDTIVGDQGHRLSGGERQRLAIARLLLKDPEVVILDEATAHLDNESEKAIQAALDEALRGRTSLVIAHRLSTIHDADQIVVLEAGTVVETGTHDQLVAREGLYRDLYQAQFQKVHDIAA